MRVFCFGGRQHHFSRIQPVMLKLREMGHEATWITASNCTNIDPSAEYLVPAGEKFLDVEDYLRQEDYPMIAGNTHGTLVKMAHTVPEYGQDLFAFVEPFWLAYTARECNEFLVSFRRMVEAEKPDAVGILHGANFWGKQIAYICSEMGVPTFSFQEGLLRHRDQATQGKQGIATEYISRVLVWSEASKSAYIEAGTPESNLRVVGIPHLDEWFQAKDQDKLWQVGRQMQRRIYGFNASPLVSFCAPLLSRFDGNPTKTLGALADWSAETFTQLAIRLHPFENEANVARIRDALRDHTHAKLIESDTIALVASSDLVLSQQSTIAVEALALGVPLAEIDLDNAGVLESLADQGVAGRIDKVEDIEAILGRGTGIEDVKLRAWLDYNVGPRDGRSAERAANEVAGLTK